MNPAARRPRHGAPPRTRLAGAARPGMALLLTLLGVLVLELVVAGVFHVSLQQLRIARSQARVLQLDAAAQSALAAALAGWQGSGADMPVGSTRLLATTETDRLVVGTTVRRIADDLYLLHAEAATAGGERRSVGAIIRTVSTERFLADFPAVLSAPAALLSGASFDAVPPADCLLPAGASPQLAALALADTTGAGEAGLAAVQPTALPTPFHVTGVDWRAFASDMPAGLLELAPLEEEGVCLETAAGNWGSPGQPEHPCADLLPIRHAVGDVTLASGEGQGVLLVDGDLTLGPGVRFEGLLLVSGTLRLLPGAQLAGAARAGERIELLDAAAAYDPCALARPFAAQPRLAGPFRAAAHWWIPSL